jgi:hypothetical protein
MAALIYDAPMVVNLHKQTAVVIKLAIFSAVIASVDALNPKILVF